MPAVSAGGEETGGGKVFLALFLTILPLAAGAGLLSNREKLSNNDLVKKVGTRFTVGFGKLHLKLFPPPPPAPAPKIEEKKAEVEPPKEEPPKPDPEQQKKDQLAMTKLYESILREQRDLKQSLVAASPEQKAKLDQVSKDLDAKRAKLKSMQDVYRRMYGKDYDPAKD
jgi:phytoene dehydrogenase-like protein